MKKFFYRSLLLSTLALIGTSCSDDDPEQEGGGAVDPVVPSVKLVDITGETDNANTFKITITTQNAVECAYAYYVDGTEIGDAETILASGESVETATAVTVSIEELDYETTYVFAAAVKSSTGNTDVATLKHTTGPEFTCRTLEGAANTYIVSEAGTYEFETKKVSGAEIENIASADWIWATLPSEADTEQRLISDVSYANGKIRFTATGERGNAAIAAFDASQTVVWVWLVWCTEQPDEMEYASGAVFLDRAIGATSADAADGTKTWGDILYQWGRSVPLFSGYVDEWGKEEVFNEAKKWTVVNPNYGLEWKAVYEATIIENSFAAPTTFFSDPATCNWFYTDDSTLWNKEKTDYDPCPAGYRIPASDDWTDVVENIVIADDTSGATYTYNGKTAYFPAQNSGRMYDTGENIVGFPGFTYWNCDEILSDPFGFVAAGMLSEEKAVELGYATYEKNRFNIQYNPEAVRIGVSVANPSFAFSVRCVKDR